MTPHRLPKPRPVTMAHYSGPNSQQFWAHIAEIKNDERRWAAYHLGLCLQEVECRVLRYLDDIVPIPKPRRGRRG